VMGFIGPVNRFGDAFVRPHDIEITLAANGTTREATIKRIVHLGFEVRVELVFGDGTNFWAQVTRREVEELGLTEGQGVFVRPSRQKVFAVAG
jgi:sulfate transport system ATP-binding protein